MKTDLDSRPVHNGPVIHTRQYYYLSAALTYLLPLKAVSASAKTKDCSITENVPVNIIDWDSDFFPALSLRLSFTL